MIMTAENVGDRQGLLFPYRVLDLSDESGFLCGKILGDLGADVIKIEPPGGDAARKVGPFPAGRPDPSKSLYWLSYNTNKRGITLNLEHPRGQDLFQKLVCSADFVIETFPPGRMEELGLGFQKLRELHRRLVLVSITPFGQSGPYRAYKGSDLVAMAMSGMLSLVGEPDRPPLRVTLPQSSMWTGMYAAAGALIAHYHRELSGSGQQVDISQQAGQLWALANAPAFWSTNRTVPQRTGCRIFGRSMTGATMRAIYRCKDGYINFIIYGGAAGQRSNEALVGWLKEEGLATESLLKKDWSRFDIAKSTQAEIDEIEMPTAELFHRYTKSEFLEQGFKRNMLGYPVADARDIMEDPHLRERNFWRSIHDPSLGHTLKFPGGFAIFSEAEAGPVRPAPRIGEHNAQVYREELGLSQLDLVELQVQKVI
ncbi:MAG: CoA transferase [Acidobacteria bacterium]|nr:CoA transferase [Acidobacteriota bacterium]